MCGIAGFLDPRGASGGERLAAIGSAMAASLRHRGPDDSGVWVDPAAGISLAHRRLSILDLSSAGRQPMHSSCGRLVLTYNGEIYNYTELRLELAASGRAFRGQSDSEVLVEACVQWGVAKTLKRLNGMFAFAVWDRKTRTLYLTRDRVGIKALYWARFGSLFLFGSELKALRAHDGWMPEIDRESLRSYMRRGHVPAPFSIYRGVHKFQAGELLVHGSRDEPELSTYWDPGEIVAGAQANRLNVGETEAIDGLDGLLRDAVGRQMAADVPLGGVRRMKENGFFDSSRVHACWREHLQGSSDHWRLLWGILMFEHWRRYWAIAPAGTAIEGAAVTATMVVTPRVQRIGGLRGA
jgi:asparagine synthase (glutamine-hydrolysing)